MEVILKPNEKEMETLTKVSEITGVDYNGKEWNEDITIESLINALDDMIYEYHNKEEEIEDLKHDLEENYQPKPFDPYDEYGVSRNDFI